MTELEREDDGYQDLIMDENERRKLQSYNINKEMKINTTRVSRWVVKRRAVVGVSLRSSACACCSVLACDVMCVCVGGLVCDDVCRCVRVCFCVRV